MWPNVGRHQRICAVILGRHPGPLPTTGWARPSVRWPRQLQVVGSDRKKMRQLARAAPDLRLERQKFMEVLNAEAPVFQGAPHSAQFAIVRS